MSNVAEEVAIAPFLCFNRMRIYFAQSTYSVTLSDIL